MVSESTWTARFSGEQYNKFCIIPLQLAQRVSRSSIYVVLHQKEHGSHVSLVQYVSVFRAVSSAPHTYHAGNQNTKAWRIMTNVGMKIALSGFRIGEGKEHRVDGLSDRVAQVASFEHRRRRQSAKGAHQFKYLRSENLQIMSFSKDSVPLIRDR